jgi:hypothetical protein
MYSPERKIQDLKVFMQDPELAIFDNLETANDHLDTLSQALEGVNISQLSALKGEKGDRGDPGQDGMDGQQGEQGEKGDRGDKGERGADGKDGATGAEGKQGSPDTPSQVRDKLESIKDENEKLDISAIKGIGSRDMTLSESIINRAIGIVDQRTSYLVQSVSNLREKVEKQQVGAGTGDALVANPLSQFAATTSLELKGVISDETGSGALVFANSPALVTPTGIVKGDVGLGNVDNTSNATERAATATLTNKRVTKRTGTTTSHATPTINTDNVDFYSLTAQAEAITSFTTNLSGTPTENQTLWIAITGTAARAITWGASFEASTVALPTTTVTTARLDVGFVWNVTTSKWRCVASC